MAATDVPDWTTESIIANTVNVTASGTVAVSSISGTVTISGAVTVSSGTIAVSSISGTVTISGAVTVSSGSISVSSISGTVNITGPVTINGGQGGATNVSTQIPQAAITSFTPTADGASHTTAAFNVPAGTNQLLVTWSSGLLPKVSVDNDFYITGSTTGARSFAGELGSFNEAQLNMDGFLVPFDQAHNTQATLTYLFGGGSGTVYITALLTPVPPSAMNVYTPSTQSPLYVTPVAQGFTPTVIASVVMADMNSSSGGATVLADAGGEQNCVLGGSLILRPSATTTGTYGAQLVDSTGLHVFGEWSIFVNGTMATGAIAGIPVSLEIPPGGFPVPSGKGFIWKTLSGDSALTATGTIFYMRNP